MMQGSDDPPFIPFPDDETEMPDWYHGPDPQLDNLVREILERQPPPPTKN